MMYKRMSDSAVRRLLYDAVRRDDVAEAENIVSNMTDMHQKAYALAACVAEKKPAVLRALTRHGCDPLLKYRGISALARCVQRDQCDMLRTLLADYLPLARLAADSRLLYRVRHALDEALFEAAAFGSADCVECLLAAGADCNSYSYHDDEFLSWCPSIVAACYAPVCRRAGRQDVTRTVGLLVGHGCDIDKVNHMHDTALYWACGAGLVDVVRLLIRNGADVNHQNSIGKTPLMVLGELVSGADDLPAFLTTATILLRHGADVDLADTSGWSALHFAVHHSFAGLVRLLLEAGAETRARPVAPPEGATTQAAPPVSCLSLAVQLEKPDIVRLLLEWNADVDLSPSAVDVHNVYDNLDIALMLYHAGARCVGERLDDAVIKSLSPIAMSNLDYISSLERPRSLMLLCKINIRKYLGRRLKTDTSSLPLPPSLLDYISSVC